MNPKLSSRPSELTVPKRRVVEGKGGQLFNFADGFNGATTKDAPVVGFRSFAKDNHGLGDAVILAVAVQRPKASVVLLVRVRQRRQAILLELFAPVVVFNASPLGLAAKALLIGARVKQRRDILAEGAGTCLDGRDNGVSPPDS